MTAAVVAFAFQAAWIVVRVGFERAGFLSLKQSYTATFALVVASSVAIAASAIDLARRCGGRRRAGAIAIVLAFSAMAVSAIVEVLLVFKVIDWSAGRSCVDSMRDYGWTALEVLAIAGFVVAAGRRTAWVAPIAVAGAVLGAVPFPGVATLSAFAIVKFAVLALVADQAGRLAPPRNTSRDQALRGLTRGELAAWISAAVAFSWSIYWMVPLPIEVVLGLVCIQLLVDVVAVFADWSIARAESPDLPRWLWYTAAIGTGTSFARYGLSWLLTIGRRWDHFDQISLAPPRWSLGIPSLVASVGSFAAIAYFARRSHAHSLAVTAFAGVAASVLVFVLGIVLNDAAPALPNIGSVVVNLLAARALRGTRLRVREPVANAFA